jgi:hypothetical protein
MDILERIVETVAQKLISLKLNEEDESPQEKSHAAKRDAATKRYEAGMRASETNRRGEGPAEGDEVEHTRQNTVGRRIRSGSGSDEEEAHRFASQYGRSGSKKSKKMPLNVPTDSSRGAPVNSKKIRGKSVNTSRGNTAGETEARLETVKDVFRKRKARQQATKK